MRPTVNSPVLRARRGTRGRSGRRARRSMTAPINSVFGATSASEDPPEKKPKREDDLVSASSSDCGSPWPVGPRCPTTAPSLVTATAGRSIPKDGMLCTARGAGLTVGGVSLSVGSVDTVVSTLGVSACAGASLVGAIAAMMMSRSSSSARAASSVWPSVCSVSIAASDAASSCCGASSVAGASVSGDSNALLSRAAKSAASDFASVSPDRSDLAVGSIVAIDTFAVGSASSVFSLVKANTGSGVSSSTPVG